MDHKVLATLLERLVHSSKHVIYNVHVLTTITPLGGHDILVLNTQTQGLQDYTALLFTQERISPC